jgi:hypothetical protein
MATTNDNTGTTFGFTSTVMDLVNQEELGSAALARLRPELDALPEEELLPVSFDIPAGVALVLGSLDEIRALRDTIAKEMVNFDLARFDKLEAYTLALNEAHAGYKVAAEPSDSLDQVVAEGERLRDLLRAEASALELRGLLDGKKLRGVGGGAGRKNLALDLTLLYKAMDDSWPSLEGKARVTRQELETAARIGQYIVRLIGIREEGIQAIAAAAETRLRIFTLFVRAYDDVRRAVHFLRWKEGDADEIAPSLHSTRNTARRKGGSTDVPPAAGVSTQAGTGPRAGTGVPAASGESVNASAGANAGTSPGAAGGAGAGKRIPGGDPFLS